MWSLLLIAMLSLFKILFKSIELLLFPVKIFPLVKAITIKLSTEVFGRTKEF